MKIKKIPYDFSICKVADYSKVNTAVKYCFTGKTDEENFKKEARGRKMKYMARKAP